MDLKVLFATFATVFLAELGDKTQIAIFSLGAAGKSRVAVFLGASAALVLSTLVAVLLSEAIAARVNPRWTQAVAGGLLIVMGGIYLYSALRASGPV